MLSQYQCDNAIPKILKSNSPKSDILDTDVILSILINADSIMNKNNPLQFSLTSLYNYICIVAKSVVQLSYYYLLVRFLHTI